MNQLKNLKVVILVIAVLLILVIIRNSNQNIFKEDVKSALKPAENGSNLISDEQLKKMETPYLVVNLDLENIPDTIEVKKIIAIPFENLLDEANLKILEEVEGNLILYSSEAAKSAKAWIILNQLGFKKLYLLSSVEDSEVFHYQFEPDTTAQLEQESL